MVKELSDKELLRRKLVLAAIKDYFGSEIDAGFLDRVSKALLRSQLGRLNPDERFHAGVIKQNLLDKAYKISLRESL